jgi:hypothetical protein
MIGPSMRLGIGRPCISQSDFQDRFYQTLCIELFCNFSHESMSCNISPYVSHKGFPQKFMVLLYSSWMQTLVEQAPVHFETRVL